MNQTETKERLFALVAHKRATEKVIGHLEDYLHNSLQFTADAYQIVDGIAIQETLQKLYDRKVRLIDEIEQTKQGVELSTLHLWGHEFDKRERAK